MRNSSVKFTLFSIFFITLIITPATNAFSVDELAETNNLVKAGGKFVTLLGEQLEVGDQAPSFRVVDKNFSPVKLSDFANQTLLECDCLNLEQYSKPVLPEIHHLH